MSYCGVIGDVVETGRSADLFCLEWRIPDFFALSDERGDRYRSSFFNACDGEWCFRIYPNGMHRDSVLGKVYLYLFKSFDKCPPKTVNIVMGIKGVEGVQNKKERTQEFYDDDNACFWSGFSTRSELREQKSRWMPGNVLILTCDMRIVLPGITIGVSSHRDESIQTDSEIKELIAPDNESQSSDKQAGIEKLSEDFAKLLASEENSDVTVQVSDVEFNVHRNILSARSSVLSAMFRHETAERATNKISIEDCEPDVFRDFLQYLYTGSVQTFSEQNVFFLYRVADKYLADDLKLQCLRNIRGTLCVQTFCEAVKIALTHGENDLLQFAIEFAIENIQLIVCSVEWQNFICEYPREANEIIIKCIVPRR